MLGLPALKASIARLTGQADTPSTSKFWREDNAFAIPEVTGAPTTATYIVQTLDPTLSNEQAIASLASGYLKGTTGTGVISSQATPIPSSDGGTGGNFTFVVDVYSPTATITTNLDSVTAFTTSYVRIGNNVIVSGRVTVDPTLTATSTAFGLSLPVATNFTTIEDCGGVAFSPGISGMGAAINADTTNDRANIQWVSSDVTAKGMSIFFMYRVL